MQTISIGELQKNVGILSNLTDTLVIRDKRKNKNIAVAYPADKELERDVVDSLSEKYRRRARERGIVIEDLDKAKEEALVEAMKEKYGFPD